MTPSKNLEPVPTLYGPILDTPAKRAEARRRLEALLRKVER